MTNCKVWQFFDRAFAVLRAAFRVEISPVEECEAIFALCRLGYMTWTLKVHVYDSSWKISPFFLNRNWQHIWLGCRSSCLTVYLQAFRPLWRQSRQSIRHSWWKSCITGSPKALKGVLCWNRQLIELSCRKSCHHRKKYLPFSNRNRQHIWPGCRSSCIAVYLQAFRSLWRQSMQSIWLRWWKSCITGCRKALRGVLPLK